jgi:hypothetical protein
MNHHQSSIQALWAIANMQVTPTTDCRQVLALCMSIAQIEIDKQDEMEASSETENFIAAVKDRSSE